MNESSAIPTVIGPSDLRSDPTPREIAEAIRSAVRDACVPPITAFPRPTPSSAAIDERFVIVDDEESEGADGEREEDFDDVSLGDVGDHELHTEVPPRTVPFPGEDADQTGTAAWTALRLLEAPHAGNSVTVSALVELLYADRKIDACRLGRKEARVAVRMAHRVARKSRGMNPPGLIHATSTSETLLTRLASDRSLPWYVREEGLLCLASRGATVLRSGSTTRSPALDWNTIFSLIEGGPTGKDDAAVRSAAIRVVVSHGHRPALGRLRRLAAQRESEPEPRKPIPGWHDGDRQIQLARAALGDTSALVTAVVRCYDPEQAQRIEAREALQAAARFWGEGMVGVARRIAAEDDVVDEHGKIPGLGGDPQIIWRLLMERHWNECVVQWAGESLKVEEMRRLSPDGAGL